VFGIAGLGFWVYASITELQTGQRLWPWSAYAFCGRSQPATLPEQVQIGLYEEFPNPWRLAKLNQVDFPVKLAISAPSRAEFLQLRETILQTYPQVQEVYFWPQLSDAEGYYLGPWSAPTGIQRITNEVSDLPLLWDLEIPRGTNDVSTLPVSHWWSNRATLHKMFANHNQPIHIWRTHVSLGLNPAFLRLAAMHFDPQDYPNVSLHLDLYTRGSGMNPQELYQLIRCGVEQYGERFIPSMGVLNDNEGPPEIFVPPDTFRRNLEVARAAGASEIWLFGVNGLNDSYLRAVRETLPLQTLPR
jgi:hypothetical protein